MFGGPEQHAANATLRGTAWGQVMDAAPYVGAMLIFGSLGLFVGPLGLSGGTIAFYRCVFAAPPLILLAVLREGRRPAHAPRDTASNARQLPSQTRRLLLAGALLVLNWAAFLESIRLTGITTAVVIYYLQPVVLLEPI